MEELKILIKDEIEQDEKDLVVIDNSLFNIIAAVDHDHMYLVTTTTDTPVTAYANDIRHRVCTLCGKTLSNASNLRKHIDDCHNENKPYQCDVCGKNFTKESQLTNHHLCHTAPRMYACLVCQKSFVRPETLKRHMIVHSDFKPYKCMFCDREFKFRTPWKMHEATHSDEQPFECNECGVKFSLCGALKEHKEEGSCMSQPFTCIDCQQEFTRRMDYLRHLNQLHGGKLVQKDFSCTYCNKSFIYQSLLRVHLRRHTGEEPYQCHKCGRTFAQRYHMRKHTCVFDGCEETDNVFLYCSLCSYRSSSKRAMSVHERTHSDNMFSCQFCCKRFTRKEKCLKHQYLCQKGSARVVPCPHCPMTFVSNTAQKIHESRIHKDMSVVPIFCERHFNIRDQRKPCHVCQVCGKCFSEKGVLNKHYRVHTGERPYQCQFCGNSFTSPSALQNHERTHTGERPHKCTLCGKRFAQRTSLVEHVRRHTKDMPHKCSLCNKGFMVPSLLKKHQQTHFKAKSQNFYST